MVLSEVKQKLKEKTGDPALRKKIMIKIATVVAIAAIVFVLGIATGHAQKVSQHEIDMVEEKNAEYRHAETNLILVKTKLEENKAVLDAFNQYKKDTSKANATLSELQSKSQELTTTVGDLQASIDFKQKELDLATANVTKAAGEPKILPAGHYTVGDHIPAGRYIITGSSNLFIRSSSGASVINTILGKYGVPEYCAAISDGMTIQTEGGATFTPAAN